MYIIYIVVHIYSQLPTGLRANQKIFFKAKMKPKRIMPPPPKKLMWLDGINRY